jgi:molybdopterin-guanine dinucleotide biosynthesis protein A
LSLEEFLRSFLAESATFSVSAFLDMHDVVVVDFPMLGSAAGKADPFFNVNTPDDLAEAEQMARRWC